METFLLMIPKNLGNNGTDEIGLVPLPHEPTYAEEKHPVLGPALVGFRFRPIRLNGRVTISEQDGYVRDTRTITAQALEDLYTHALQGFRHVGLSGYVGYCHDCLGQGVGGLVLVEVDMDLRWERVLKTSVSNVRLGQYLLNNRLTLLPFNATCFLINMSSVEKVLPRMMESNGILYVWTIGWISNLIIG